MDIWYVVMFRMWPVHTVHRQYIPSSQRPQRVVLMSCISRVPLRQKQLYEVMRRRSTTRRHTCRWRPVAFIISLLHPAVLFQAFLSRVHLPCRYFLPAVTRSGKCSSRVTELHVVKLTVWELDILSPLYKYTYLLRSGNSTQPWTWSCSPSSPVVL